MRCVVRRRAGALQTRGIARLCVCGTTTWPGKRPASGLHLIALLAQRGVALAQGQVVSLDARLPREAAEPGPEPARLVIPPRTHAS